MKKIYLILSHTGTRIGKCLRFFTKYPYNHVSVSLDPQLSEMYGFSRRSLRFPLIAGLVHEHPMRGAFLLFEATTTYKVCEIEVTEAQYAAFAALLSRFVRELESYKYNFLGIPFMLLRIPFHRKRHFVCSQFVGYMLLRSGIAAFGKDYSLVKPKDIDKLPCLNPIYEGSYRNYPQSGTGLGKKTAKTAH